MYIESLHVKNVRLFTELNVKFGRKFNILAGPNGCGKTSILACISHCFDAFNYKYSQFKNNSDVWTDIRIDDQHIRVGLSNEATMAIQKNNSPQIETTCPPFENPNEATNPFLFKYKYKMIPLFIGTQRDIKYEQIQGIEREKQIDEYLSDYSGNATKSICGDWQTNIKQWIINRYFVIEKEWAGQIKQNWEQFVEKLPQIAPFGSEFSFVETREDFEPKFSLYGNECHLEELSAGYQAVLSLIVSIIAWIERTMQGDNRLIKNAVGVVCIDEPDIHLHPEWQLTLRHGLVSMFPNLQFIVTTHSPHLLASAEPGEIIPMPKAYTEDRYDLEPINKSYSGWTTDEILTDVMGVESLENKDYERLVSAAMDAAEKKDKVELEKIITELEKISHPSDSIVTVLKIKLASLELS
jgi:predicted ATP-binding protein involved in virulence